LSPGALLWAGARRPCLRLPPVLTPLRICLIPPSSSALNSVTSLTYPEVGPTGNDFYGTEIRTLHVGPTVVSALKNADTLLLLRILYILFIHLFIHSFISPPPIKICARYPFLETNVIGFKLLIQSAEWPQFMVDFFFSAI